MDDFIDCELDNKMSEMYNYLDRMVLADRLADLQHNPDGPSSSGSGTERQTPPLSYIPNLTATLPEVHSSANNCSLPVVSSQYQLTNVTSALANSLSKCASSMRVVDFDQATKAKMWRVSKILERAEPDRTEIDIRQTFVELGLTPESLVNNEVYKLFSTFNKLAFVIHADYCSEKIYEGRTLPNTMSVSVHTRHAAWSCTKLLRQLHETLTKYTSVGEEYQVALSECIESLEGLRDAINQLEIYKYCSLEHRKGIFVSRENLEPLFDALRRAISCVGRSRMCVEVFEYSLAKCHMSAPAATESSHEEPSQPTPGGDCFLGEATKGRPILARRNIG